MRGDLNRWFDRELKKVANEAIDLQKEIKEYGNIDNLENFVYAEDFLSDVKRTLDSLSELEDVYQDLFLVLPSCKIANQSKVWDDFSMYGKDATCVNSSAFWSYLEMVGLIDTYTKEDGTKAFYFC